MEDDFDLERFVTAQDGGGTYLRALAELRAGRKQSHWMWFVLPQLDGLGRSDMSRRYGISGLDEAAAYAAHPVVGPRLLECVAALLAIDETDPAIVLGAVDAAKLRSSMTLFAAAVPGEPAFGRVLARYFDAGPDEATLSLLSRN